MSTPRMLSVLALLSLGGCTAVFSTSRLLTADRAVTTAQDRDALTKAPYELTLAERYLDKAVEASTWSENKVARQLADEATRYATTATVIAEGGERGAGLDEAGAELTDEGAKIDDAPAPTQPADDPFGDLTEDDELERGDTERRRPKRDTTTDDGLDIDFDDVEDDLDLEDAP